MCLLHRDFSKEALQSLPNPPTQSLAALVLQGACWVVQRFQILLALTNRVFLGGRTLGKIFLDNTGKLVTPIPRVARKPKVKASLGDPLPTNEICENERRLCLTMRRGGSIRTVLTTSVKENWMLNL